MVVHVMGGGQSHVSPQESANVKPGQPAGAFDRVGSSVSVGLGVWFRIAHAVKLVP